MQPAMRPGSVVMIDVLRQYSLEVASTENDQPVKALAADASHPALGVTVRNRSLQRRADYSDAFGGENMLDRERKLLVVVADQEPNRQSRSCSCQLRLRTCWLTQA